MSRDHGRSPHPAARASSVDATNKPWEGDALYGTSVPVNPQAAHSTACTDRDPDQATAPVLWSGRLGFAAGPARRDIDIRQLPDHERRYVWRGIKLLDPALAELLRDDAGVQGFRETFDAELALPFEDYRRFFEAGKAHANGER